MSQQLALNRITHYCSNKKVNKSCLRNSSKEIPVRAPKRVRVVIASFVGPILLREDSPEMGILFVKQLRLFTCVSQVGPFIGNFQGMPTSSLIWWELVLYPQRSSTILLTKTIYRIWLESVQLHKDVLVIALIQIPKSRISNDIRLHLPGLGWRPVGNKVANTSSSRRKLLIQRCRTASNPKDASLRASISFDCDVICSFWAFFS